MKALELYEAAFDSACDHAEPTSEYVVSYAEGGFGITLSDEVASVIIKCHLNFIENGNGTNDYFYMIEKPLADIKI